MAQNTPFVCGTGSGHSQSARVYSEQQQTLSTSMSGTAAAPALSPHSHNPTVQPVAPLPGMDMSALAGISPEQLAHIVRLLQSGALPLPPPPPNTSDGPRIPHTTMSAKAAASPPQEAKRQHGVIVDMEEGEVEEGEGEVASLPSMSNMAMKVIPKGPRNAGLAGSRRQEMRGKQLSGPTLQRRPSDIRDTLSTNDDAAADSYRAKERQSKDFVLAMHQAGYSYRQLAEMVDNPDHLRRMFKLLGLPMSIEHGFAAGGNRTQSHATPPPANSANGTATIAQRAPAAKPSAPSRPTGKADRSAYLAKLQALKAGRAATGTTQPALPVASHEAMSTKSAQTLGPSGATAIEQTGNTPKPSAPRPTPTSKAVKTELARQRLEAFKAERAALKLQSEAAANEHPVTSSPAPVAASHPKTSQGGLGAGLNGITALVGDTARSSAVAQEIGPTTAEGTVLSAAPPKPSRSFSGLPGLFPSSLSEKVLPASSSQLLRTSSQPITRAASADELLTKKRVATDDSHQSHPPAKRPFGQSRSTSEDESFIIENSDDEGDANLTGIGSEPGMAAQTMALVPEMSLQSSPPVKSAFQPIFAVDAAGGRTPGGTSYEQHMRAIEDMNRKIAAKEAKRKTPGNAAKPSSDAAGSAPGLPGISATSTEPSAAPPVASIVTAATAPSSLRQEKERLSRRLEELEARRKQADLLTLRPEASSAPLKTDINTPALSETLTGHEDVPKESQAELPTTDSALSPSSFRTEGMREEGEVEDESDFDFYGEDEPTAASKPFAEQQDSTAATARVATEVDIDIFPEDRPADTITAAATAVLSDEDANMTEEAGNMEGSAMMMDRSSTESSTTASDSDPTSVRETHDAFIPGPDSSASDVEMYSGSTDSDESSDREARSPGKADESAASDGENEMDGVQEPMNQREDDSESGVIQGSVLPKDLERSDLLSDRALETKGYALVPAADLSEESPSAHEAGIHEDAYDPDPVDDQLEGITASQAKIMADDGLAPELQPAHEDQTVIRPNEQPRVHKPKAYYTPYVSIMTKFRDYRYHPQYLDSVPSGFKSRTYNHQIDPLKQLCQTEAQGGTCNDGHCRSQHFDKMAITDNMLLQQMGTKRIPARTNDEIKKWNLGLQDVIKNLKAANVRDATTIAARIAEFRREFVGDPTKIISFPLAAAFKLTTALEALEQSVRAPALELILTNLTSSIGH